MEINRTAEGDLQEAENLVIQVTPQMGHRSTLRGPGVTRCDRIPGIGAGFRRKRAR
jgi:hypothetical protein